MVAMAVVVGCAVGLEVLAVLVVVMVRGLVAVAMAVVTACVQVPTKPSIAVLYVNAASDVAARALRLADNNGGTLAIKGEAAGEAIGHSRDDGGSVGCHGLW